VFLQNSNSTILAKDLSDTYALLGLEHDATKGLVHGLNTEEGAAVLVDNVNGPSKNRPGFAGWLVGVASGVDVRTGLVDGAVDRETGSIDGDFVASYGLAFLIDMHHIASFQHTEMNAESRL
jgi:hypothetical protein